MPEKRFTISRDLVPYLKDKKKMFLDTIDFEYTYIKKWCYAGGLYK